MHYRILILLTATLALVACTPDKAAPARQETVACQHYRLMLTAPMPPEVMQRLAADCQRSRLAD